MGSIYIVAIVAISFWALLSIIKIGTRYSENIERIKHGYPLTDGTRPIKDEVIDVRTFESKLQ